MVQSTSSILSIVPTLAQIMQEHSESNPEELKKIKEILEDKEVVLTKQSIKVNWWIKKEVEAQAKLQAINELLLQRDKEIEAKWQRL